MENEACALKIDGSLEAQLKANTIPSLSDGASSAVQLPCFPKIGVLAFVPERWGGVWLSRHQILTRLAKYFNVVWVDPAVEWRNLWFRGQWKQCEVKLGDSTLPGFRVYRHGIWLPKVYKPHSLGRLIEQQRLSQARQMLLDQGCERIVLYLWRPEFGPVVDDVAHDLSCYHIVDEYSFSTVEQPLDRQEGELIARAGQVFIHSPALWDKKGHLSTNSLLVPNGVDFNRFATPQPEPDDLKPIARPRMGYVGFIQSTINWSLLYGLAKQHGDWSFVFVGPRGHLDPQDEVWINQLLLLENAHFLGGKSVHELGAYAQNMNVCMMPYKVNDYTKFIYPLKLHEYLASGRPTIGTPIRSLQDYGHVVTLASTVDEWSDALGNAMAPEPNRPEQVEARRNLARTHDWAMLVERIAKTMCNRLSDSI